MAYLAIKKVKGHRYAYLQESYRDGQKVCTRTVAYLGAVDGTGALSVEERARFWQVIQDRKKADGVSANEEQQKVITTKTEPEAKPRTAEPTRSPIKIPNSIGKHKVNCTAIFKAYEKYARGLEALDIKGSKMPHVTVRYGWKDRCKRNRDGSYSVIVARRRKGLKHNINRVALWKNYRQALSSAYLEAIGNERPELYHALQKRLDRSHAHAKQLLIRSISVAVTPLRVLELSLHVMIWNKIPRVRKTDRPQDYGQVDFSTVGNWKKEATHILAEVHKSGWIGLEQRCKKSQQKHIASIKKQRKHLDELGFFKQVHYDLSGKRRKTLRQIMQYEKRLIAISHLQDRLYVLKRVLPL